MHVGAKLTLKLVLCLWIYKEY